jgi:hypothetical protein
VTKAELNALAKSAETMAASAREAFDADECLILFLKEGNLILGTPPDIEPEAVERMLSNTLACVRTLHGQKGGAE